MSQILEQNKLLPSSPTCKLKFYYKKTLTLKCNFDDVNIAVITKDSIPQCRILFQGGEIQSSVLVQFHVEAGAHQEEAGSWLMLKLLCGTAGGQARGSRIPAACWSRGAGRFRAMQEEPCLWKGFCCIPSTVSGAFPPGQRTGATFRKT